jgi:serine/threonine protein kinase
VVKAPQPEEFKMLVLNKKQPITELYNFGELLGSGSFASVYACIDLKTGNRVAIKVLKKNKIRGKERKHLLEMEIEIMFVIKGMIRKNYDGIKSLCEIFKVIEDHKRVRINQI